MKTDFYSQYISVYHTWTGKVFNFFNFSKFRIYSCLFFPKKFNFLEAEVYSLGFFCFFSVWVFFHNHWQITELQGKGEGISLSPHYHFHPLHSRLDISRTITAESPPLYIRSSLTRTENLKFWKTVNYWFLLLIKFYFFSMELRLSRFFLIICLLLFLLLFFNYWWKTL